MTTGVADKYATFEEQLVKTMAYGSHRKYKLDGRKQFGNDALYGPTTKVAKLGGTPLMKKFGKGLIGVGFVMTTWQGYENIRDRGASKKRAIVGGLVEGTVGTAISYLVTPFAISVGASAGSIAGPAGTVVGGGAGAVAGTYLSYTASNGFNYFFDRLIAPVEKS